MNVMLCTQEPPSSSNGVCPIVPSAFALPPQKTLMTPPLPFVYPSQVTGPAAAGAVAVGAGGGFDFESEVPQPARAMIIKQQANRTLRWATLPWWLTTPEETKSISENPDGLGYAAPVSGTPGGGVVLRDRKSTRLNSSHPSISYAVFCLKKKKKTKIEFYLLKKKKKAKIKKN